MRLTNNSGVEMFASGETAEFYLARGYREVSGPAKAVESKGDSASDPAVKREAAKAPAKRGRPRKVNDGVDATG